MKKYIILLLSVVSLSAFAQNKSSTTINSSTKTGIGLGNVDNTSDINKPVSTPQQAALDLKAPLASPTLTGTVTVPNPALLSNTTVAATTSWIRTRDNYVVNVKDYGAIPGDGADDATAINSAIAAAAAGQTVFFPDGSYNVSSTITVNKSITLLGGFTNINVSGNFAVITVTANAVRVEHIRIIGSGKDTGSTSQNGILSSGYYYLQYKDCEFYSLGGAGVNITNTNIAATPTRQGARLTNCYFNGNNFGYLAGASAEYITLAGCYWQYNNTGVLVRAGNNNFIGGSISDNLVAGVKIEGGALNAAYVNDGHGIFNGVLINHNKTVSGTTYVSGYNVFIEGITLGYTFSACHFYDSKIYVKDSKGAAFVNCHLAPIEIIFQNSFGTQIKGCTVYRTYGFTVTNGANTTQSQTQWQDNRNFDGLAGSFLESQKGGYYSGSMTVGSSIATGTSAIPFTTVTQATSNNLSQTQYAFYDATNSAIENKGLGDNHINVNLNLNFSLNVAADASKVLMYLEVYNPDGVNSVGRIALVPSVVYDAGNTASRLLMFTLQGTYGMEPTQKIKVMILNNSGFVLTAASNIIGTGSGAGTGWNRVVMEGL